MPKGQTTKDKPSCAFREALNQLSGGSENDDSASRDDLSRLAAAIHDSTEARQIGDLLRRLAHEKGSSRAAAATLPSSLLPPLP